MQDAEISNKEGVVEQFYGNTCMERLEQVIQILLAAGADAHNTFESQ